MKTILASLATILLVTGFVMNSSGQEKAWRLEDCINYALEKNIQIQKTNVVNERNRLYTQQAKATRTPSVNSSIRQNFSWDKSVDTKTKTYGNLAGSNSTNYSISSNVSLFNGFKIGNKIKQAELSEEGSQYNTQTVKESMSLTILNAFLQILYAQEQVNNAQKQIDATTEQLNLASERLALSVISQSDYLAIKSELANEQLTLANAKSQLSLAKVDLMQLMELPVENNFTIVSPQLDSLLNQKRTPDSREIYELALGIKPQIKSAQLNKEVAELGVKVAQADQLPTLSMDAGLSTGYSSISEGFSYGNQFSNNINPAFSLTVSVPIAQRKQIKTNISLAKAAIEDAALDEINTRNQLRKDIEQACENVVSAQVEYTANVDLMAARNESYQVATEKFKQGLMNSVDYLFEKTNLITSESKFLQSKYNLIFSYKILDFYKGISLTL